MITLVLSDIEVQAVMEGLSNLPLHKSFDSFVNVRQQVMQQRQAQATPPQDVAKADTSEGLPNGRVPN